MVESGEACGSLGISAVVSTVLKVHGDLNRRNEACLRPLWPAGRTGGERVRDATGQREAARLRGCITRFMSGTLLS